MYDILYSEKAKHQLEKLDKPVQKHIISVLERVRIRPEAYATKLVGSTAYRLRAGDYRIIIDIDRGQLHVLVITIAHRRNVYKG